jgi:hypothetical protein
VFLILKLPAEALLLIATLDALIQLPTLTVDARIKTGKLENGKNLLAFKKVKNLQLVLEQRRIKLALTNLSPLLTISRLKFPRLSLLKKLKTSSLLKTNSEQILVRWLTMSKPRSITSMAKSSIFLERLG